MCGIHCESTVCKQDGGIKTVTRLKTLRKVWYRYLQQGWKLSGSAILSHTRAVAWLLTVLAGHELHFLAQKLGPFCQHFYCLLHMPWRRGPRTFCNRPEVVFNCNGVLAWVCHFQQAAFSSLAKRPGRCPVSVSTLQLLIAGCELPANLSPNAPAVKWVIFNTVTAPVMSAKFSPDTTKQIQYYLFSEAGLRFWHSPQQNTTL